MAFRVRGPPEGELRAAIVATLSLRLVLIVEYVYKDFRVLVVLHPKKCPRTGTCRANLKFVPWDILLYQTVYNTFQ